MSTREDETHPLKTILNAIKFVQFNIAFFFFNYQISGFSNPVLKKNLRDKIV